MESTASKQLTAFRESFMAGVDEKGNARRLSKDSKCFSRYAIWTIASILICVSEI